KRAGENGRKTVRAHDFALPSRGRAHTPHEDEVVRADRLAAVLACALRRLLDQPPDVCVEPVERIAGGVAARVLDHLTDLRAHEQHLERTIAASASALLCLGHVVLLNETSSALLHRRVTARSARKPLFDVDAARIRNSPIDETIDRA